MKNVRIRAAASASGVYLWELAAKYGVTDSAFSRKLRKEFSPEEEEQALNYIRDIAMEKGANND